MANRLGWLKIALNKPQEIRKQYEKQYEKYQGMSSIKPNDTRNQMNRTEEMTG